MSKKSMFGINDCHKARKNTKKSYTFGKRLKKTKTLKLRHITKNKFKHIILFPHKLGQTINQIKKSFFNFKFNSYFSNIILLHF